MAHASAILRHVAGGWEATGLISLQSGPALTIMAGRDQSQTNLRDRAVINGSPYGPGACGSAAPCKGLLTGPGLARVDAGFSKNIPIRERLRIQVRAEFFNAFNRANFNSPNSSVSGGGFGSIRSAADPRVGQLALKFLF